MMKATSAMIDAPRFPVVWSDNPDLDPPPGRDIAQSLLDELLKSGRVQARQQTIGDRDYEHAVWFFDVVFGGADFVVHLEGHPDDRQNTTWRIWITKSRGIIRSLFGGRDSRFDVPDDCLRLMEKTIALVFGVGQIQWITEDQAVAKFWK